MRIVTTTLSPRQWNFEQIWKSRSLILHYNHIALGCLRAKILHFFVLEAKDVADQLCQPVLAAPEAIYKLINILWKLAK